MNKHKGVLEGVLDSHAPKGSQGVLWILREDGKEGGAAVVFLDRGDELLIYPADGSAPLYEKIMPDYKTGRDPKNGQQQVFDGHWVHWIQEGWQPNDWARLFIRYDQPKLRATLFKP